MGSLQDPSTDSPEGYRMISQSFVRSPIQGVDRQFVCTVRGKVPDGKISKHSGINNENMIYINNNNENNDFASKDADNEYRWQ